jgi:hypothetical protein
MINKNRYNLHTEEQALRYFIEKMDIEMISAFINKNQTYQNMQVTKFLEKLENIFVRFKSCGDEYLLAYKGNCGYCYKEKQGYIFVGNFSFNYLNLIIDNEKGLVKDMFDCTSIKTKNPIFLNKRFYLDLDKLFMPLK